MFGNFGELVTELRALRQRADSYVPQLLRELQALSASINRAVDTYKDDVAPVVSMLALQAQNLGPLLQQLRELAGDTNLIERIEELAKKLRERGSEPDAG